LDPCFFEPDDESESGDDFLVEPVDFVLEDFSPLDLPPEAFEVVVLDPVLVFQPEPPRAMPWLMQS
jgi:hypothetical protein